MPVSSRNTAANWDGDVAPLFDGTENIKFGTNLASGLITTLDGTKSMNSLQLAAILASGQVAEIQPGSPAGSKIILQSGNLSNNGGTGGGRTTEVDADIELGATGSWYMNTPQSRTIVNGVVSDGGNSYGINVTGSSRYLEME